MPPTSSPVQPGKLAYIDNLRGIAVLLVLLTHVSDVTRQLHDPLQIGMRFGQMGVQLFFIVSAFTLCLSAEQRKREDRAWTKFYLRRFFRIAPLYYFGILLYLFFFSVVRPWLEGQAPALAPQYTWKHILANVLLMNDFYPGMANNKVVPGGWSIGTETTFYLIFPLVYSVYRWARKSDRLLLLLPLCGVLLSYLLLPLAEGLVGYPIKNNNFLYFNLFSQLPIFLLGMSLYFKLEKMQASGKQKLVVAGFAATALLALSVYLFAIGEERPYPFLFTTGLTFLFFFFLFRELPALSNRYLGRLGQLSYSIYLLHFMFAWDGMQLLFRWLHPALSRELLFGAGFLLSLVLTAGLALLTEKYIEQPGMALGKKVIKRLQGSRTRMLPVPATVRILRIKRTVRVQEKAESVH